MPVLRDMNQRPEWCELADFRIVRVRNGEEHVWRSRHPANKLLVVEGRCRVASPEEVSVVGGGEALDRPAGEYRVTGDAATVVELGGHWGDDCGGAGVFAVERSARPREIGDPASYPKHTNFDRHYHDCDEYWIVVSGSGTASSEDRLYQVGPGDCVATRMGDHHDFPLVEQPVTAVFFETTMRGERRRGHLWEHTHGPARRAS